MSSNIARIRTGWRNIRPIIHTYVRKYNKATKIEEWPELNFEDTGQGFRASMCSPLLMKMLPYRHASKNIMHVVIHGGFDFDRDANSTIELLSYRTQIRYLKPERLSEPLCVKSIDGYHFDMGATLSRGHPVFHAQRDGTVLKDEIVQYFQVEDDQHDPAFRQARIPTPQIDFVSALIMVIADHLVCDQKSEKDFFDLVVKVRRAVPLKVNLNNQAQLIKCIEEKEMLLDHWYKQAST